jgi:hypothetical protein
MREELCDQIKFKHSQMSLRFLDSPPRNGRLAGLKPSRLQPYLMLATQWRQVPWRAKMCAHYQIWMELVRFVVVEKRIVIKPGTMRSLA